MVNIDEKAFLQELETNSYNVIKKVSNLFGLRKVGDFHYSGIFLKGEFDELFDYNCGILSCSIKIFERVIYGKHNKSKYYYGLVLENIDDGSWVSYSNLTTKEECEKQCEKLFESMKNMIILPKACDFNKDYLIPCKLYGIYSC